MKKITVRKIIEMLTKCNGDDECTCISKAVNEKIREGKVDFDKDLGAEIDELDVDSYKYKIVGISQFVGIEGRGIQIIFDGEG